MVINVRLKAKNKVSPVGAPVSGWLGARMGLGEADGLGDGEADGLGEALAPGDGLASGEGEGDGLGLGDGDGEVVTNWVITNSKSS